MSQLTHDHIAEFQTQGYTILCGALSSNDLTMLHDEADLMANYIMDEGYDIVRELGCIIVDIGTEPLECGYVDPPRKSDPYKTNLQAYCDRRDQVNPGVSEFLTTTAGLWAGQLLYDTLTMIDTSQQPVYLLNEQYIIKPPKTKSISQFAWHRDSDYYQDKEWANEVTVACWIALDDVDLENGTLLIGHQGKGKEAEQTRDTVQVPAGSVVFMSSHLAHKSTGNASARFRRAFMPQYSTRPFLDSSSSLPLALAIPLNLA